MNRSSIWFSCVAASLLVLLVHSPARTDTSGSTSFTSVVRDNFKRWDANGDGVLSEQEVDRLLLNPSIKGEAAAALAAIHHHRRSKAHGAFRMTQDFLLSPANNQDAPADERRDQGPKAPRFRPTYAEYLKHIQRVPHEIFHAKDAPTLESFHQGQLGDCYFLSAVAAMVARNPETVRRIIRAHPDGSADVSFPDGRRTRVSALTDAEIALGSTAGQQGLWLNVLEKAFGQVRRTKHPNAIGAAPATDAIGSGGAESETIQLFTGHKSEYVATHKGGAVNYAVAQKLRGLLEIAHREKLLVCCDTGKHKTPGIAGDHAYSVLGFDSQKNTVIVRNPWGNRFKPKGDPGMQNGYPTEGGVFQVPLNEFVQIFESVTFETRIPLGARPGVKKR